MPIDYSNYPKDWKAISRRIRDRAGDRCEWTENGKRCEAVQGQPNPLTGSTVVLTVAHLNHDTGDNSDGNLAAWCQLHHLRYDAAHHAKNAAATRRLRKLEAGQGELL